MSEEEIPKKFVVWRVNRYTGVDKPFLYTTSERPKAQSIANLLNAGNENFYHYLAEETDNDTESPNESNVF